MGALDLNKVAIAMGKMLKLLTPLEQKGTDYFSIDDNKEEYFTLAYIARVGILDRIEQNPYMQNPSLQIIIPLGLFKSQKERMASALEITVGKLIRLSEGNDNVNTVVNNILERGEYFYEFEAMSRPELC